MSKMFPKQKYFGLIKYSKLKAILYSVTDFKNIWAENNTMDPIT